MNPLEQAVAQRDWHRSEAKRLDAFIKTYHELTNTSSDGGASGAVRRSPGRPKRGVGADTMKAAEDAVRVIGPMGTRDLLAHVQNAGIEVGGNNPVATLSARISGKGSLVSNYGKWQLVEKGKVVESAADESSGS